MKKIWLALIVSVALTGCAPMLLVGDAVYLTGKALDPNPTLELYAKHSIESVQGQKVYAAKLVQFLPESLFGIALRSDTGCEGSALVVDYARDWDVLDKETSIKLNQIKSTVRLYWFIAIAVKKNQLKMYC